MSEVKKPVTKVRTGNGDGGTTKLAGKTYRKSHALVAYSAALDTAQGLTVALPEEMGTAQPQNVIQEVLHRLGAVIGARLPKEHELAMQEMGQFMEKQIATIAGGLPALDSFIRCTDGNVELHQLRSALREAECRCVAAWDQVNIESKDTSPQLLYMLEKSMTLLNIASDWVFCFMWMASTNPVSGKVSSSTRWIPWTEEKIRSLNAI